TVTRASPNRRRSDASLDVRLPVAATRRPRVVRVWPLRGDRRLAAFRVDFGAPRERVVTAALACVTDWTEPALHELPLASRHALVRGALLAEGVSEVVASGS